VTLTNDPEAIYWSVDFGDGSVEVDNTGLHVRAVRGGYRPFPAYVNQPPTAVNSDVKHPWKFDCVPLTFLGSDLDSHWAYLAIDAFPQHGFLTEFVSSIPDCQLSPGICLHPIEATYTNVSSFGGGGAKATTLCYVSFDSNFAGTDSITFHWFDSEGAASNTAVMTVTIFEN